MCWRMNLLEAGSSFLAYSLTKSGMLLGTAVDGNVRTAVGYLLSEK